MLHRLALTIAVLSSAAHGQTCAEIASQLAHEYRRALVGETRNPVLELETLFPGATEREIPKGLYELETDVFAMIVDEPPETRNILDFANKYGLTADQARDVIQYYDLMFLRDLPRTKEERSALFGRLSELHHIYRLNDSSDPLIRRHRFYLAQPRNRSVPEMAKQLGVSEGQVYSDLSLLRIGLVEAFLEKPSSFSNRNLSEKLKDKPDLLSKLTSAASYLEQAQILVANGYSPREAAKWMGLGEQALDFMLTHTRDAQRGVTWSREFLYRGERQWEVQILVDLYERGLTRQQIADRLNELAGVSAPDSPDLRTSASVSKKLEVLGLTEQQAASPAKVEIEEYGVVKEGGALVPGTARQFLLDHSDWAIPNLATKLGVTEAGLKRFMKSQSIVLGVANKQISSKELNPLEVAGRYQQKRESAAYRFIRLYRQLGNQLPKRPPGKSQNWSSAENEQNNAYQWMYYNRDRPQAMNALPEDIRRAVEAYTPQARSMNPEAFTEWYLKTGARPKRPSGKSQDWNEAEKEQNNAYTWMLKNRQNPTALKALPEDVRKVVEAYTTKAKPMNADAFAAWYIKAGALPKRPSGKSQDWNEAEKEQHNAYRWVIKNRENPEALKALPETVRKVVEAYTPQARSMNADTFAMWYLKAGRLPKYPSGKSQDWSEAEKEQKNAYTWIHKNRENPEVLKALPETVRKAVEAYTPQARSMNAEAFAAWYLQAGELPMKPSGRSQDWSEAEKEQYNAYQWMINNREKPNALKALPEGVRKAVESYRPRSSRSE